MPFILISLLVFALFSCQSRDATEVKEEAEVRRANQAYNTALNQKDVNALLDFWTTEAVYRNPVTGKLVQGKENIKQEYFILFDEMQNSKVEMSIESISFPFDDKAVVEGILHLQIPGEKPIDHDYTMIFVKRDGKWKILNVSEINLNLTVPTTSSPSKRRTG